MSVIHTNEMKNDKCTNTVHTKNKIIEIHVLVVHMP